MMKVLEKIARLREERGWTINLLATKSGLSFKTVYNWYNDNSIPTIKALEAVADAFGINIIELFTDEEIVVLDEEMRSLIQDWKSLNHEQQQAIKTIIKTYKK